MTRAELQLLESQACRPRIHTMTFFTVCGECYGATCFERRGCPVCHGFPLPINVSARVTLHESGLPDMIISDVPR